MELMPIYNKKSSQPIYIQLYNYIKEEIINGRLEEREKLPSIRQLSKDLGISRTTVENAYQQLFAEGYIYSLPKKGYYISKLDLLPIKENNFKIENRECQKEKKYEFDFKNEYVEKDNFNFSLWKKHINYVLQYEQEKLYSFGDIQGETQLRNEITKYIHRTRGVCTNASNIVIGAGVQPLLNILTSILKKLNINGLGMEDPGFNRAKNIFNEKEFKILPLPVSKNGIDINRLEKSNLRLCYVSPSHQFPTGTVMKIEQRIKLIKWANAKDGYIIEDDYNSELRYEGKPIPAMQGLDKDDRVIYLGSFSTVLVPSIRISFMALPDKLIKLFNKYKHYYAQTVSKVEQLVLARFMETGDLEKHIRKIRNNYSKKYEKIVFYVKKYMSDNVEILHTYSGLLILLKLKCKVPEEIVVSLAEKSGILITGLKEYLIDQETNKNTILIINYRGIEDLKMEEGIKKLAYIIDKLN